MNSKIYLSLWMSLVMALLSIPLQFGFSQVVSPPVMTTQVGGYAILSHAGHLIGEEENDSANLGKLKVTAVIKNESDAGNKNLYNWVVEGYDSDGVCIDTETLSRVNLPMGQEQSVSIIMNLGTQIKTYKTFLVPSQVSGSGWLIVSSAKRIIGLEEPNLNALYDAGRMQLQVIVKNDNPENTPEICSLVAESYDKDGKRIEVVSTSKVNIGSGFTGKLSVLFKAPSKVKNVKFYMIDGVTHSDHWQIITTASRIVDGKELDVSAPYDAGKFKVEAVIKNNAAQEAKELFTVIAEGYDANGKCIDVGTRRIVNLGKGFTTNASILLSQGQKIKSYRVSVVGGDHAEAKVQLISTASHVIGKDENKQYAGYLSVASVFKNACEADKKVTINLLGYNQNGKLVDSQSKALTMFTGYNYALNFQLKSAASIKTTKFEMTVDGVKKIIALENMSEPTEAKVMAAYKQATEIYKWFSVQTLATDINDVKQVEDTVYYRVVEADVNTYEGLKARLMAVLDEKLWQELLDKNLYKDVDGALYGIDAARGSDITKGSESYKIKRTSDSEVILTVTVDLLSNDGSLKKIGTKDYVFKYERVKGDWVFTKFPEIR